MSSTLGKMRLGSLVSSAMLTESSKPTMAKKASVVPAITAQTMLPSALVLNSKARAEVAGAGADGPQADDDDDQQAGQLDAGQHAR